MVGRITPYVVLYLVHFVGILFFQMPAWGIPLSVSFGLFAFTFLLLVATAACGILLGSCFKNPVSALVVTMFSTYPIFMLSGYVWPQDLLPPFYHFLAQAIPVNTYFCTFTALGLGEVSFGDVVPQFIQLGIVTFFLSVFAAFIHKKVVKGKCI